MKIQSINLYKPPILNIERNFQAPLFFKGAHSDVFEKREENYLLEILLIKTSRAVVSVDSRTFPAESME